VTIDSEQVMHEYLLGGLASKERDRVDDRLAADPVYFDAMAAAEDDLIEQWLRGRLPPDVHERFQQAYQAVPARWARVEASRGMLEAMQAWEARRDDRHLSFFGRLAALIATPRLAPVAAGIALVVLGSFLWSRNRSLERRLDESMRALTTLRETAAASAHVLVAFTLTAVPERGAATGTLDRLRLPADAAEIRLSVELDPTAGSGPFAAELEALDGHPVTPPGAARMHSAGAAAVVTVTVPAPGVLDGDYVLRIRREPAADVVATRAFRVSRE
jgi:hypothetical protein